MNLHLAPKCRWCNDGPPEWSEYAKVWIHRRERLDRKCENQQPAPDQRIAALTAERDAARAAARELGQALKRVIPMGLDAAHEHFSDMEGKEDTRTEALWNASNVLAKHADLGKESHDLT